MNSRWWNPRLNVATLCVAILALHWALLRVMERYDVVSSIFALGNHVPYWMATAAMVFVITRLALYLAVPGILAWWCVARCTHLAPRDEYEVIGTDTVPKKS